jgi:hypothetical protein
MFRKVALSLGFSLVACNAAFAVEGGTGAYLMGSRDLGAGFVPPPGTYQTTDFIYISATTNNPIGIGGLAFASPELEAFIIKPGITYVPAAQVLNGRVGLRFEVPIAWVDMTIAGALSTPIGTFSAKLKDDQFGIGDPALTPMIGWDFDEIHVNLSASMYIPVGNYDTAKVSGSVLPLPVTITTFDVLSVGKNKFGIDPTVGVTFLDKETGFELSGALGITFSAENDATDYQTAPELHFEATVGEHFANGLTLGAIGYLYQQLGDDSGSGAASIRAATGANSLEAHVYGVGGVLNYSTKVGNVGVSLEAKYLHEFDAEWRFESDVAWGTLGFAF